MKEVRPWHRLPTGAVAAPSEPPGIVGRVPAYGGGWSELGFKVPPDAVGKETVKSAFPWPELSELSVLLQ